ncbi:Uncharacterised protein [Anaerococcus prevotii]|uniref:Uncharacterized protein n=1 Tax=Anaerococcus prevotii (strain ATCC 9321 / DSM 20548 / JCM 6508 / NCTC 11806 / PC1) TaxID=525919 RepID=C7RE56_ANAPD|nr:hypothetical protein Apre_1446 [Anaerococcus prevotii DSM 20548]SUU95141.1 Uncharacterised protein [Anaerococcus prevotii]
MYANIRFKEKNLGIFSTREISILIWLTIIISLILIKKETRIAFIDCIKLLFEPKIAIIWFIYCLYIFLITILLTNLSIWKRIYIKDIIIWTILVGMINYFKSITDNDSVFSLRKLIKDNINVTIIVEFIISIFTFDIILELIIAPIATILSLLSLYIERNSNYENVYKIIDGIMGAFGLFLAFKTIGVGIYEYKYLNIKDTLVSFMIPIIYSFLSITLYYIIRLYVRYEVVFVSLPFSRVINSKIKKRRFYKIFKVCRFSIEKLEYFYKNYVPYMYESMSEEEFDDVLKSFILECQSTYLETSNEK